MCCIGVELRFEIDQHWPTRGEFLIGNGLLKFRVARVYFGVENGGVEAFAWHGEVVDEREVKTAQTFDRGIASSFAKSRGAAARDHDCDSAEESVSNDEILRGSRAHKAQLLTPSILLTPASGCQDNEKARDGGVSIGQKAAERRRTPKRQRESCVGNHGHVLECGNTLPLLTASKTCCDVCYHR